MHGDGTVGAKAIPPWLLLVFGEAARRALDKLIEKLFRGDGE
jgi:hypothetical protein